MSLVSDRLERAIMAKSAAENMHKEVPRIDLFSQWEDSLHRELRKIGVAGMATTEKAEARLAKSIASAHESLGKLIGEVVRGYSADVVSKLPKEADLSGVSRQIAELSQVIMRSIQSIPATDLSGIASRLDELASREEIEIPEAAPQVDYSAQLAAIEARLAELEKPRDVVFQVERVNSNPLSPIKRVIAKAR